MGRTPPVTRWHSRGRALCSIEHSGLRRRVWLTASVGGHLGSHRRPSGATLCWAADFIPCSSSLAGATSRRRLAERTCSARELLHRNRDLGAIMRRLGEFTLLVVAIWQTGCQPNAIEAREESQRATDALRQSCAKAGARIEPLPTVRAVVEKEVAQDGESLIGIRFEVLSDAQAIP